MTNKAFIRTIWGDTSCNGIRNGKMNSDIMNILDSKYENDFVVYTFGEENHAFLESLGFDSRLISKEPVLYDMEKQLYRHKLDALKAAMEDFDEIAFLDWDCRAVQPIPSNFWEICGEKEVFQANLFLYRTKKCLWREADWRKVCNGGYLYLRDKNIPDQFIKNYDELSIWVKKQKKARERRGKKLRFREEALMFDDEPAISKWVDNFCGEWPGMDTYWELFEPERCNLKKKSAFTKEMINSKDACFVHWG